MTLYVDSSAWVKRYVSDPESAACVEAMSRAAAWITCRHTLVEVIRAIGTRFHDDDRHAVLDDFNGEWLHACVIDIDQHLCALAADVALETGARSLDALHIAGALRAGGGAIDMLTYDQRQAAAARRFGLSVQSPS